MTQHVSSSPRKTRTVLAAIAGLAAGVAVGCIGGIAIGSSDNTPAASQAVGQPQSTDQPGATEAAAPPAPAGPATTIGDGVWVVGVDIAPGTWRPTAVADSNCYWSITKSGSNGRDIVSNNIGGGRPTVVVKEGQDFEVNRCGTWAKQ
jgi:hypothetical protein